MKIKHFVITLVLGVFCFFSLGSISKADILTENQFNELQLEGVYGLDVTYQDFIEAENENLRHLERIEAEPDPIQARAAFSLKKGDVLVTNGTSSKGITGHAAIAISSTNILHISGPKAKPSVLSLSSFKTKYLTTKSRWIKIYRSKSSSGATKAADWVIKNYKGKNYSYAIDTKLSQKDPTYCSKIVWQGFRYGVGESAAKTPLSKIIGPYYLDSLIQGNYKLSLQTTLKK